MTEKTESIADKISEYIKVIKLEPGSIVVIDPRYVKALWDAIATADRPLVDFDVPIISAPIDSLEVVGIEVLERALESAKRELAKHNN